MRITCPFCGDREHSEFTYLGDAAVSRPDPNEAHAADLFAEAFYLRDNPAGDLAELWYHGAGCRRWLRVTRNTRTHAISAVAMASGDAS